jgi:outer membrane protein assembly factor BamB
VVFERLFGGGYSAVLVAGDRLYTGLHDGEGEKIVALRRSDGKSLWQRPIASEYRDTHVLQFGKGPNATPLLAHGRLFSVSFGGRAYALDSRDGSVVWQRDLVADFGAKSQQFGYSTAPIQHTDDRYGDLVIFAIGGDPYGAVGLRQRDGKLVWKAPPFGISYAAPMRLDLDGEAQIVFMAPTEVVGVRLADGQIRWRHPQVNRFRTNCATPLWRGEDQTLFLSSQADAGSRVLRLAHDGAVVTAKEVVANPNVKLFHNNAIRLGDVVYGVSDSHLVAYDTRRDKLLWRERGYPEGRLVYADGKVFLLDERGVLSLATVSPRGLTLHGRMTVLEKPSWTPPTLAGGRLYLRDTKRLVVLDVRSTRRRSPRRP